MSRRYDLLLLYIVRLIFLRNFGPHFCLCSQYPLFWLQASGFSRRFKSPLKVCKCWIIQWLHTGSLRIPFFTTQRYKYFLLQYQGLEKKLVLANLPVQRKNNPSRTLLPQKNESLGTHMSYHHFLHSVARARYIVSPIGDRADTYRHMEALGLGTVPVCNCPSAFGAMYGSSMKIFEMDSIIETVLNPSLLHNTTHVRREVLLASYWKAIIDKHIQNLEKNAF